MNELNYVKYLKDSTGEHINSVKFEIVKETDKCFITTMKYFYKNVYNKKNLDVIKVSEKKIDVSIEYSVITKKNVLEYINYFKEIGSKRFEELLEQRKEIIAKKYPIRKR